MCLYLFFFFVLLSLFFFFLISCFIYTCIYISITIVVSHSSPFFFILFFFFLQLNGGVSFYFIFNKIAAVAGLCAYKAHRPQYSITIHPYALLIGFSPPLFFLLLLFSHVYAFALIINAVAHHRDATIIKVRTRLFSLTFPCTLH